MRVLDALPNGTSRIRNLHDVGKIECPRVEATIESDLLYPLLRGRGIARWKSSPEDHILMVQDVKTQKGYDMKWMQQTHPLAWSYLKKFEDLLRTRKAFQKFFNPVKDPFYSMYSVTTDTLAEFKVCWMDISSNMKVVVVECSGETLPIPEHGVMFAATGTRDESD